MTKKKKNGPFFHIFEDISEHKNFFFVIIKVMIIKFFFFVLKVKTYLRHNLKCFVTMTNLQGCMKKRAKKKKNLNFPQYPDIMEI